MKKSFLQNLKKKNDFILSFPFVNLFNKILVFFLIIIFSVIIIDQNAFGHSVPNLEEQESFILISDEQFSRQSLKTGQTLTIQGTLIAKEDLNIDQPLSVYLETEKLCTDLDVFFTEPQGVIGHVNKGDKIPYQIKLTLDAGVFHAHTLVHIESFGESLGTGVTIVVEDSSDTRQTSELCDERNNGSIIGGTILIIALFTILFFFIIKHRKHDVQN